MTPGQPVRHELPDGPDLFTSPPSTGPSPLLIPAALLIASGGDVRTALVNLIFYALFAPACGQMINRIMYMSEAVMEADEAIGRLDEILGPAAHE